MGSEGKWHGKGIKYYENGNKLYEGDYSEGKWHGKGIEYHENGKKMYEVDYSEDKWHGKGIEYQYPSIFSWLLFGEKNDIELHGQWVEGKADGQMRRIVKDYRTETYDKGKKK